MSDLWQTWASDQTVSGFLADADALVAEGAFPDRRAAFVAYAGYVLSELGPARRGPGPAGAGLSAEQLGDLLLAHTAAVKGVARRRRPTGRSHLGLPRPGARRRGTR